MSAFFFFARLHCVRWYRYSHELGFIRTLFLLFLAAMVIRYFSQQFDAGNHWIGLLIIPLLQAIQVKRKDRNLLKSIGVNGFWLYSGLFLLMSSPILLAFLLVKQWTYLSFVIAFCFLISLTQSYLIKPDVLFVNIGNFLPCHNFEWKTGLRQYGLAVCTLLLIGLGLSFYVATVPLVIFFLTLNTAVFYLNGESKELLSAMSDSPRDLIWKKIKTHLVTFYSMLLPLIVLFLVFNYVYWYVLAYVLVVSLIVNINAIIFKYASYEPGATFDDNTVLQALSMVSFLVPFTFPIPIILSIVNYRKALNRLSIYY